MTADYARMHRHIAYRRWAFVVVACCGIAALPEGAGLLQYHFPWWDDIAVFVTFLAFGMARVVIRRTEMYAVRDLTNF